MRVPTFVVIGGGADGVVYVRQLLRAVAAGRLETDRILVVDREATCPAAWLSRDDGRVRLALADWSDWLDAHLNELGPEDHLVPYHWAPHLLLEWLERQAERSGAAVRRGGPLPSQSLPFERATAGGDLALSYATWACPPTCIEPALCPHTRGPKDWSLAGFLAVRRDDGAVDERIVFRCTHLVWGVGTIPVAEILAVRDRVLAGMRLGRRRYLVATASHCHGLAASLEVSPAPAQTLEKRRSGGRRRP